MRCRLLITLFFFIQFLSFISISKAEENIEYGGQCAMGMSLGEVVTTDCSIQWKNDDGRAFCFSSADSKSRFLENPEYNAIKADEYFNMTDTQIMSKRMQYYKKKTIKKFLTDYISDKSQANDGFFPLPDPITKGQHNLVFEEIQMLRTLHGYGFFPDVIFHAKDDKTKKYWVDFWLKPIGEKGLEIVETRIYKGPKKTSEGWQLLTRQPVPWWWIPASEHPGESEQKRGWEIMSAIENHILEARNANNGKYELKDPESGEMIAMEYIAIHQPVRRLSGDGQFFACTDFRKEGTTDQYYDIDFWLDEKSGNIRVGEVRVHKVPEIIDGNWVQVPKYHFDDLEFDVVP